MKATVNYSAQCPYCKIWHVLKLSKKIDRLPASEKIVVNCDIEEGGCEEDFVVYVTVNVSSVTYGLDFKKSAGDPHVGE